MKKNEWDKRPVLEIDWDPILSLIGYNIMEEFYDERIKQTAKMEQKKLELFIDVLLHSREQEVRRNGKT